MPTNGWWKKYHASPDGFTFEDVEETIAKLNEEEGYTFEAEKVTEGGIEMIDWSNKTQGPDVTKSFRLGIDNWPWLPRPSDAAAGVKLERRHADLPAGSFWIILTSSEGAPTWKDPELKTVVQGMEDKMRVTVGGRKYKRKR